MTRADLIAWRDELARCGLGGSSIRHRLASLVSQFEYSCEKSASPIGQRRREAKVRPLRSAIIRRQMLDAPDEDNIESKRDRAILSTHPFHALRRRRALEVQRSTTSVVRGKCALLAGGRRRWRHTVSTATSRPQRAEPRKPPRHRA